MAEKSNWVITTSRDRPIDEVEKELSAAGFSVEDVLGEIPCITGTGSAEVARKVRAIPGVEDVSEAPPPIDIGPPDAEIS